MSSGSTPRAEAGGPPRGLCDSCLHQRLVPNTSRFGLLALRASRDDPAYPRYPRLPVAACPGHEERS